MSGARARSAAAGAALVLLLAAGCASDPGTAAGDEPSVSVAPYSDPPPTGYAPLTPPPGEDLPVKVWWDGDWTLPRDTLEDWVTYADGVIVATVVREEQIPPDRPTLIVEPGGVGRRAEFAGIEVLFERSGAPTLPSPLQLQVPGWFRHGLDWARSVAAGQPLLELGGRYLLVVTYRYTRENPSGGELQIINAMPAENGVAGEGEWSGAQERPGRPGNGVGPGQQALIGLDLAAVSALLAQTPPDPFAVPFVNLPPDERWEKAGEQRYATPSPTPS